MSEPVWIPGATFRMGSDAHYPEEAPVREVTVDGFHIDRHQVTNREFARFARQRDYVTVAERRPDPAAFPGAPPENLVPGSLVFTGTRGPVDLRHINQWWRWTPGASWRHPEGPGSALGGRLDHPVVHIAYEDAAAFAEWAGKTLPTEAQWELAARGGLDGAAYVWGDEPEPPGERLANYWHGDFPWRAEPGLRDDRAGGLLRAQRPRAVRHGRQRVGVDERLVLAEARPGAAAVQGPAQGGQGRLVPVRRQLLPALPARGAAAADGRHGHEPRRLPLRHDTPDPVSAAARVRAPWRPAPRARR
jgi:formylglycine-generating enzyme required for sulfatase activity